MNNPRSRYLVLFAIIFLGIILRLLLSYEPIRSNDPIKVIEIAHEIVDQHHFDPLEHRTYGNRYAFLLYTVMIYVLVGTNQLHMQLFYIIPSVFAVLITYKFSFDLTTDHALALKISLLHATLPLELIWSGSGTLDAFFGLFVGLFFWFYYRGNDERWSNHQSSYLFLAGFTSGLLVSIRVLGFFVYIAITGYLVYRREELGSRIHQFRYLLLGFLAISMVEFVYLTITVGNPFYGILRRIGFSAGGQPTVDLSTSDRIDDPIFSTWVYPRLLVVPHLLGWFGILLIISVIYFALRSRDENEEISIWILTMFMILQWFPLYLILDPLTVLREEKSWWFEKQPRFFTTFTIVGLTLVSSLLKQIRDREKIGKPDSKLVINTLFVILLSTNLLFSLTMIQPIDQENNISEVADFFQERGIDAFYVDHPGIPQRYEVVSHYTFTVSVVNSSELDSLHCSYLVTNSSIREYSNLDPSNYPHWILMQSFDSKADAFLNQYWQFEFTTRIYFTNSPDQSC